MIVAHAESTVLDLSTLSAALIRHSVLLKAGLTPYEAQCATFTVEVEQALDALPPRVQENFGLYMHFQVEQIQKEACTFKKLGAHNVLSMSDHINHINHIDHIDNNVLTIAANSRNLSQRRSRHDRSYSNQSTRSSN